MGGGGGGQASYTFLLCITCKKKTGGGGGEVVQKAFKNVYVTNERPLCAHATHFFSIFNTL